MSDAIPDSYAGPLHLCPYCVITNPPGATLCRRCGALLPIPMLSRNLERGHVGYTRQLVLAWHRMGLLSAESAAALDSDCARRQSELSVQPAAPALPEIEPPMAPVIPPTAVRDERVQRFVKEHGLKLTFAFAALLILVALRSMIAWEAVGAVVSRVVPALFVGLTAMFLYFGHQTRDESPWAAWSYHAVGVVLSAFTVAATERFWLSNGPGLYGPMAAVAAAGCVALALLARRRTVPYLHLFLIALSSLFACIIPVLPRTLNSGAAAIACALPFLLLACGALYCLYAEVADRAAPGSDWRDAFQTWVHLGLAGAAVAGAARTMFDSGSLFGSLTIAFLFAALVYGAEGQLLSSPRMVALCGTFTVAGAACWGVSHDPDTGRQFAWLLTATSLAAAAMAAWARRGGEKDASLRSAWLYVGASMAGVAMLPGGAQAITRLPWGGHPANLAAAWMLQMLVSAVILTVFTWQLRANGRLGLLSFVWSVALSSMLEAFGAPCGAYPFAASVFGALLYCMSRADADSAGELTGIGEIWSCSGAALSLMALSVGPENTAWWSAATLATSAALIGLRAGLTSTPWRAYYATTCVAAGVTIAGSRLSPGFHSLGTAVAIPGLGLAIWSVRLSLAPDKPNSGPNIWHRPCAHVALVCAAIAVWCAAPYFMVSSAHAALAPCIALLIAALICFAPHSADMTHVESPALFVGAVALFQVCGLAAGAGAGIERWNSAILLNWGWSVVLSGCALMAMTCSVRKWRDDRRAPAVQLISVAYGLAAASLALRGHELEAPGTSEMTAFALFTVSFLLCLACSRPKAGTIGFAGSVAVAAIAAIGLQQPFQSLALCLFGACYAAAMFNGATQALVASSASAFVAAYLAVLGSSQLSWNPALSGSVVSGPRFALWCVLAAAPLLGVAILLRRKIRLELVAPLYKVTAFVALLSGACAIITAATPHDGVFAVAALLVAAGVWATLWALKQGDTCLHLTAGNILAVCWLMLYDHNRTVLGILDLYALPLGLYLLLLGHRTYNVKIRDVANQLWWAGLVTAMSPALAAHWFSAADWHAELLILECVAALGWGLINRVRAFPLAAILYGGALLAVTIAGRKPSAAGALIALACGVALFAGGFYLTTHREIAQRWASILERRWRLWQAWR